MDFIGVDKEDIKRQIQIISSKSEFKNNLVEIFTGTSVPLRLSENMGFKCLISSYEKEFNLVLNRRTIRNIIIDTANKTREYIKSTLTLKVFL